MQIHVGDEHDDENQWRIADFFKVGSKTVWKEVGEDVRSVQRRNREEVEKGEADIDGDADFKKI